MTRRVLEPLLLQQNYLLSFQHLPPLQTVQKFALVRHFLSIMIQWFLQDLYKRLP